MVAAVAVVVVAAAVVIVVVVVALVIVTVAVADADGVRMLADDVVGPVVQRVVDARLTQPDGPRAHLPGGTS